MQPLLADSESAFLSDWGRSFLDLGMRAEKSRTQEKQLLGAVRDETDTVTLVMLPNAQHVSEIGQGPWDAVCCDMKWQKSGHNQRLG